MFCASLVIFVAPSVIVLMVVGMLMTASREIETYTDYRKRKPKRKPKPEVWTYGKRKNEWL